MSAKTLVSWNVNGVRAIYKKGFLEWLDKSQYDVVCLQETKVSEEKLIPTDLVHPHGYTGYWDYATEKKGYSGVVTFARDKPRSVTINFGDSVLSREGRLVEADFGDFVLLNVYFPNGKASDERLQYKMNFYDHFLEYLLKLKKQDRKIIFCGDVNTAHTELDIARPKENSKVSGFLPIERAWLDKLTAAGFIDTFRLFEKGGGHYSWWDQFTHARERNVGWRIDYFFVSDNLRHQVKSAFILADVLGSDHCPVGITLKL
ncbi:MAG: exodeoxyribonuclease III [Candidatus Vogelbacteria bacterium]|nr:exodeoxyribonuclease III [Candidatus Vogelbacteria bacterium]